MSEMKFGGVIDEERGSDYICGTIPYEVVCENWTPYLPTGEKQLGVYIDCMGCVTFSALNVIETQLNFMLANNMISDWAKEQLIQMGYIVDGHFNFSDRFTAKMSGTTKDGNSFQKVWDSIRKDGLLPQADWDYPTEQQTPVFDWEDFYADVPQSLKDKAKSFLNFVDIQYEWVVQKSVTPISDWELEEMKKAIKQAPLQYAVPVCHWNSTPCTPCGKYSSEHGVMGWNIDTVFNIEDSYAPFLKTLSRDYIICYVLKGVVTLKPNVKQENMIVDEAKLNQIYNELLVRSPKDGEAQSSGYLGKEEAFVRNEIGKSSERQKVIVLVNAGREMGA